MSGFTQEEIDELWSSKRPEDSGTALVEFRSAVIAGAYVPPRQNRQERRKARTQK